MQLYKYIFKTVKTAYKTHLVMSSSSYQHELDKFLPKLTSIRFGILTRISGCGDIQKDMDKVRNLVRGNLHNEESQKNVLMGVFTNDSGNCRCFKDIVDDFTKLEPTKYSIISAPDSATLQLRNELSASFEYIRSTNLIN